MSESGGQIDLLVLGGGMAGLSAAAYASEHGRERGARGEGAGGRRLGSRTRGFIHTAADARRHARGQPRRRPEAHGPAGRGLRGGTRLGALARRPTSADPIPVLGYSRGCRTDMANYLLACERLVREHGELLTNATAERLLIEDGAVTGAVIRTAGGRAHRSTRARRCWPPAVSAATPSCARSTSTRSRATSRCARTPTAPATACGWRSRPEPASARPAPASTGT